jgi:parallel beta-helix repeat protein
MLLFSPSIITFAHDNHLDHNEYFNSEYSSKFATEFDEILESISEGLVNHSPIYVEGNANLSALAAAESWQGDGSATNPYIISGLRITGSLESPSTLIEIRDTDLYVQICNNELNLGAHGIYLSNTEHVTVYNNTIFENSGNGLTLKNARSNNISYNFVTDNLKSGISLENSMNNTLSANFFGNNKLNGVRSWYSANLILYRNTVSNNDGYAVNINYSPSMSLINNSFVDNGAGVSLAYESGHSTFNGNYIAGNDYYGLICTLASDENLIEANMFQANRLYGLTFHSWNRELNTESSSNNNVIRYNDFHENNGGDVQAKDDGINNTFHFNYWNDWTSPDGNGDGIVDNPYSLDGWASNTDSSPWVSQNSSFLNEQRQQDQGPALFLILAIVTIILVTWWKQRVKN